VKKFSLAGIAVGAALLCAAPFSLQVSRDGRLALSADKAVALIGRPWTPFSIAGVHRRAYRRGYYGAYGYQPYGYYGYRHYGHYGYHPYRRYAYSGYHAYRHYGYGYRGYYGARGLYGYGHGRYHRLYRSYGRYRW
jgi:hypothetical protein